MTSKNWRRNLFLVLLVTPSAILVIWRILGGVYSTPFWMGLLLIASLIFALPSIVGSFVFLFFELRKNIVLASLPIILNAFLFYAFINFDFEAPSRNADFRKNLKAQDEVVEMVMSGKLNVNKWGEVKLPDGYKHLSRWEDNQGSALVLEEDSVFFATSYSEPSGPLVGTHYWGFVYTKEKNPSKSDFFDLDENDAFIKMKNHWTWIEKD